MGILSSLGVVVFLAAVSVVMVMVIAGPVTQLDREDLSGLATFSGLCCNGTCDDRTSHKTYNRYLVLENNVLYVGAMNFMYMLNKTNLECNRHKEFPPDSDTRRRCTLQGKSDKPDCQNHIRVIIEKYPDQLFVCGTGAYYPTKYTLNRSTMNIVTNLSETESPGRGNGICPFDPNDNATSLYTTDGNLGNGNASYFGTYTDFLKNNPVFFRPKFIGNDGVEYTDRSTDQDDSKWLNPNKGFPQFAGSFDEGNQVFTFFRESALEYPDASVKKTYARVAKVCKKDLGGGYMNKKKWLSFQKARLNCSLPGRDPYYFDDLNDVYRSGDLYFGLFYKQGADLNSSAICVYSKAKIEESFSGKFKYKDGDIWKTLPDNLNPNPRLDNCAAHDSNPSVFENRVSEYQLMDKNVDPEYDCPIFYKHGVQLIKIVVGPEFNRSRNIYVASDKGVVYDIFMKTFHSGKPKCIENAVYKPIEKSEPIWAMKLKDSSLYLGTDHEVVKFDLMTVCPKMNKCDACVYNTLCAHCNSSCMVSSSSCTGDITDHNDVEQTRDLIEILKGKGIIKEVTNASVQPVFEGAYSTLQIQSQKVRFSDVVWTKSGTAAGREKSSASVIVIEDSSKYATSDIGDLIIRNATKEDSGTYEAKSVDDGRVLERIELKVNPSKEQEDMVNVWKQAFNDWSTSFRNWQSCSSDYFDTCRSNG